MTRMRLHETRTIDRPIQEVFAYTADFSNIEEWDPGVVSSRPLQEGPPAIGSKYELVVSMGMSKSPMTYEVTVLEPGRRVVLVGTGARVGAIDDIGFSESDGGDTIVDYTADLSFGGWLGAVAPVMKPLIDRIGRRALDGLVGALGG